MSPESLTVYNNTPDVKPDNAAAVLVLMTNGEYRQGFFSAAQESIIIMNHRTMKPYTVSWRLVDKWCYAWGLSN